MDFLRHPRFQACPLTEAEVERLWAERDRQQAESTAEVAVERAYEPERGMAWAKFRAMAMERALVSLDRKASAERRRQKRTVSLEELREEPSVPGPLPQIMANDAVARMLECLRDSVGGKQLLTMLLDGMSTTEIAEALGECDRTIRKRLQKLRGGLGMSQDCN